MRILRDFLIYKAKLFCFYSYKYKKALIQNRMRAYMQSRNHLFHVLHLFTGAFPVNTTFIHYPYNGRYRQSLLTVQPCNLEVIFRYHLLVSHLHSLRLALTFLDSYSLRQRFYNFNFMLFILV